MNCLYELDFKKIAKGCEENWFGSIDLSRGTAPKDIHIDQEEPLHLVQILFNSRNNNGTISLDTFTKRYSEYSGR